MKPVKDNEDSAVSEIIGALLLFAIGTTVLTGFILWYVPSTGMTNDQGYQSATQSAFTTLDSKILSPSLAPGSAVSQSFPLGVSGAPPFSSPTDSSLCYSNNFSASMKENYSLNYYNRITYVNNTIIANANATNSNIYNNIYADNQFAYSVSFIENGLSPNGYWSVSMGGRTKSSSSTLISFSMAQGTYGYKISGSTTQLLSSRDGSVVVNDSNVVINVEFYSASSLSGIIAENNGTTGDLTPINSQNTISDSISKYTIDPNNVIGYWLNGSIPLSKVNATDGNPCAYALASQAFNVYQTTPLTYYIYYLMQSDNYLDQYYVGGWKVYSYISEVPLGANIANTNITPIVCQKGNSLINGYQVVNLTKLYPSMSFTLKAGQTYYINFFEQVNTGETQNNDGYYPNVLTYANGNIITSESGQWGYGPTELIGTIQTDNSEFLIGAGSSQSFTMGYCQVGSYYNSLNFNADNFSILHIYESTTSGNPYVFVVGYSLFAKTPYTFYFNQTSLNSTQQWNVSINGISNTSIGGKTIIFKLPVGVYQFSVNSSNTELGSPSIGIINVTSLYPQKNVMNVTFSKPRGTTPAYYGITREAWQAFTVTKPDTIFNYVSLYMFNFTTPPSSYKSGAYNSTIKVSVESEVNGTGFSKSFNIQDTGWAQLFFGKTFRLGVGPWKIVVSGEGGSNNIIDWGFSTSGGFDNYLVTDASNLLTSQLNENKTSNITTFSSGLITPVTNQVFMFQVGYYNLSVSNFRQTRNITLNYNASGEILSSGFTQFTYQAVFAIQDGASLEASGGVTYATVNPLPIQFTGAPGNNVNPTSLAFSSYIYNIDAINGIPTSISGDGSTILTMSLANRSALNYTVGNSYYFGVGTQTELVKVVNITLNSFNYTLTSDFAKYWEDSFYTQLPHDKGSSTNFNVTVNKFNFFRVTLSNDKLFFGMTTNDTAINGIPLYSISTLYENFLVTQV
ncbi:MAG: hypothetical protein AAE985_05105 [Thermoplasmataceae archaeon]|jgi:hypothetical protein